MSRICQVALLACGCLVSIGQAERLRRVAGDLAPEANEVSAAKAKSNVDPNKNFPTNITVDLPKAIHFAANATAKQVPGWNGAAPVGQLTFQGWYNSWSQGRGIWKWSNAVDAYQRHFYPYAGQQINLAEVGVQSGGSMIMWSAVLGAQCHVYGLDINPKTQAFADATHTIVIGDQADPKMWANFFTSVVQGQLHILVDDGGHEPHQMRITLVESFNRIAPGGLVAIEDIHGMSYIQSFFLPAAQYLGAMASQGHVESVHMYPFLLVVQKSGTLPSGAVSAAQFGGSSTVVSDFAQLWQAIPYHPGGHVILENAGWGAFNTANAYTNFFQVFGNLQAATWHDIPTGCEHTANPICTVLVTPEAMQSMILGIHIYASRLIVEVAGAPVTIQAVRHGTEWIQYA